MSAVALETPKVWEIRSQCFRTLILFVILFALQSRPWK